MDEGTSMVALETIEVHHALAERVELTFPSLSAFS